MKKQKNKLSNNNRKKLSLMFTVILAALSGHYFNISFLIALMLMILSVAAYFIAHPEVYYNTEVKK